ncbi:MAG: flagellar motor protein MotA [Hyphomicrobiales bacterium]
MAESSEHTVLEPPRVYLVHMMVFTLVVAILAAVLYAPMQRAFLANPGLNALIIATLLFGMFHSYRMVWRLFPEIGWVNDFRISEPGAATASQPRLLAPMATLLRNRQSTVLSPLSMRSLLDSLASRLDESRDLLRYLVGLLIFLGLLGTFWGLLETVSSVGDAIRALDVAAAQSSTVFEDLKSGLERPLAGMGLSFSSSLFGLAGSLILGFLDLKASQAQNRFYNDLEDWLSTITDIAAGSGSQTAVSPYLKLDMQNLQRGLDKIGATLEGVKGGNGAGPGDQQAIEQLADAVAGLVQQMREEQKMVRQWAQSQQVQQNEIQRLLIRATGQTPARGRARVEDEE